VSTRGPNTAGPQPYGPMAIGARPRTAKVGGPGCRPPGVSYQWARCAGDVFACRHCLGLAYWSQQEPVRERGIATARKIRMGLGGGENVTEAFPAKPKGMHWRRYSRLRRRHDRAFARALMGLAKSTERLERWLFR
jgi:hypothetical protein